MARLLVDSLIFAPISLVGFFTIEEYLEYRSFNFLKQDLEEFVTKIMMSYALDNMIWVPANLVNFWFIPIPLQGLYVGFFNFLYSIGLSYITYHNMHQLLHNYFSQ